MNSDGVRNMRKTIVILVVSFGLGIFAGCKGSEEKAGRTQRRGGGSAAQKLSLKCEGKIQQFALDRAKSVFPHKESFPPNGAQVEAVKLWGNAKEATLVENGKKALLQYAATYTLKKDDKAEEGLAVFFADPASCKISGLGASLIESKEEDAEVLSLEKRCEYSKKIEAKLKCDEKCKAGRKILSLKAYQLDGKPTKSIPEDKDADLIDFYVIDPGTKDAKVHQVLFDTSVSVCDVKKITSIDLSAPAPAPAGNEAAPAGSAPGGTVTEGGTATPAKPSILPAVFGVDPE
jgi:hypothetical protein